MKPETINDFPCPTPNLNDTSEVCARSRIQINNRIVGVIQRLNSRVPGVDRDGAELDGVEERKKISSDNPRLLLAAIGFNFLDPDFAGRRLRSLLLVEAFAGNAVGETLEDKRAIQNRRKDERSNARVIPHHIPFGVFLLGAKNLVKV